MTKSDATEGSQASALIDERRANIREMGLFHEEVTIPKASGNGNCLLF